MNRLIRFRVRGLAIVLLLSLFLMGCDQCSLCVLACLDANEGSTLQSCYVVCMMYGCPFPWTAATDNPEECQEGYDSWAESPDTEAEE